MQSAPFPSLRCYSTSETNDDMFDKEGIDQVTLPTALRYAISIEYHSEPLVLVSEAVQPYFDAFQQRTFQLMTTAGYSAQTDPTSAQQTDPTKTDGQIFTFDCCFLMIKDCF